MNYLEKYSYTPSTEIIGGKIERLAAGISSRASVDVLRTCFSVMDLTTLNSKDTENSVLKLVTKANMLRGQYPDYPLPASICVYPNFVHVVRANRCSDELHVTTVAGCFPSSQSFLQVKVSECELAVQDGADEIDIVLALNAFLVNDYERAAEEIRSIRAAVDAAGEKLGRRIVLKVILETGVLSSAENIAQASFLAMEAGADFIKTSTGKVDVGATPMAAFVMCECIRAYYLKTGRKVGFKAAGGISSAKDAVCYYHIVSEVLGSDWLCKDLFRLGVSRLGNALISEIEQETVTYF